MLLDNQKVAIFEGTYSEIRGGRLVQNLKPRRRGYRVGETLGGYKVVSIDKSHVTLSALSGNNVTLIISKSPPAQKVRKTGGTLNQKSRLNKTSSFSSPSPSNPTAPYSPKSLGQHSKGI